MAAKKDQTINKQTGHPAWLGGEANGEAAWEAYGDTTAQDAIIKKYSKPSQQ